MTYVNLFSGAGGWELAAQRLGLTGTGIDNWPIACATSKAAGHEVICGDVRSPSYYRPSATALIASPPCQTFSGAGKGSGTRELIKVLECLRKWSWEGDFEDERTGLVLAPLQWILQHAGREAHFEWIAMEQVPRCLQIWESYAEILESIGYYTWTGTLNAEQYGVPQTRRRAVLLAHRQRPVKKPEQTHVVPVSMANALGWNVDHVMVSNYGTGGDAANRGSRRFSQPSFTVTSKINRNRIVRSSFGKPKVDGRNGGHQFDAFERPAHTVTGKTKDWSIGEDELRLTPADAGVLQGFPHWYPWQGSRTDQFQQIGNAIPVQLAEAILREVAL